MGCEALYYKSAFGIYKSSKRGYNILSSALGGR